MKWILVIFIFGCSSKEAQKPVEYGKNSPKIKTTRPTDEKSLAKLFASEQGTNRFKEISFKEKNSSLTQKDKSKVSDLVKDSLRVKKIDEIKILAWGDNKEDDGGLADRRIKTLEIYLDKMFPDIKKKSFNMSNSDEEKTVFQSEREELKRSINNLPRNYEQSFKSKALILIMF